MTAIYCVKCRESTDTKSEKRETTESGRHRLIGICANCGTKKGVFVNKQWKITVKTDEQREEAKNVRMANSLRKKAEKIGWKVLANPDAKDCVRKCLAKKK